MANTNITGKTVILSQPSYILYNFFSDFKRFEAAVPENSRAMAHFEEDSILVNVKGMELGAKIHSKIPFSLVELEQYGNSPFPFLASFHMEPMSDNQTCFHIEFKAELNMMMKMLIGKKLQDAINKITDGIAQAVSGQVPEELKKYMNNEDLQNFMAKK